MKVSDNGKFLLIAVVFVLLLFTGTGCAGGKEGKVIRNDKKGIPNKVLYEAVLDFGDANEDGILTVEEAAAMEDLVVVPELRDIIGLKGLEYCTGLKNLILENLAITDLSALSGLKSLNYLILNQNKITDISPLAGLTNLSKLYLKENEITNVDKLAELTSLECLILSGNKIENADALKKLTGLRALALDDNEITDIRFLSELTNLEELWLGGNEIKDIQALSGLTGLKRLELDNNAITEVGALSKLVNLEKLNLSGNEIMDISPLSGLVNLGELNLSSNKITDVSPLFDMKDLQELSLTDNAVTDIRSLAGLTDVERLYLNDNQITDVSPLSGLLELYILDISNNQIADISPLYVLCMEHYLEELSSLGNPITNTGGIPEYVEYEEEVAVRYLTERDKASLMERFELSEYDGKVICGEFFGGARKYSPYDVGHGECYWIGRNEAGELVLEKAVLHSSELSSIRAFEGMEGELAVVLESGNCWFIYSGDVSNSGLEFTDKEEHATRIEPFAKTAEPRE